MNLNELWRKMYNIQTDIYQRKVCLETVEKLFRCCCIVEPFCHIVTQKLGEISGFNVPSVQKCHFSHPILADTDCPALACCLPLYKYSSISFIASLVRAISWQGRLCHLLKVKLKKYILKRISQVKEIFKLITFNFASNFFSR